MTKRPGSVFRLPCFERQCTFMTQNQLISEVKMHYERQFRKQLKALVLELSLKGELYGLMLLGHGVVGLAMLMFIKDVQHLFSEFLRYQV